jgi:hypothetical protein
MAAAQRTRPEKMQRQGKQAIVALFEHFSTSQMLRLVGP